MNVPDKIDKEHFNATMARDICAINRPYPSLHKHLTDFVSNSTLDTAKDNFNKFIVASADHLSSDDRGILVASLFAAGESPELTAGIIHWIVQKLTSK